MTQGGPHTGSQPPELEARVQDVQARILRACRRAGRQPETVRLVAVSKRHPGTAIRAAYALGLRDFGENYIQELSEKCAQLADLPALKFHAIGHLQRNKARSLVKIVQHSPDLCLHTIDSEQLVSELTKRAAAAGVHLNVFIEVNVGREAQKSGCLPEHLPELLRVSRAAPQLTLLGLMAIPPSQEEAEASRVQFRELRELSKAHCPEEPRLSMGMSHDFEIAIEEGATDVRIGSAIFGPRAT